MLKYHVIIAFWAYRNWYYVYSSYLVVDFTESILSFTQLPVPFLQVTYVDDNAQPHCTRPAQQFFHDITRMFWPENSPDLNPIENFWDNLKRWFEGRGENFEGLRASVLEDWGNIDQESIYQEHVIRSHGPPMC